jgi:hypothetical protein
VRGRAIVGFLLFPSIQIIVDEDHIFHGRTEFSCALLSLKHEVLKLTGLLCWA